MLLLPLFLTLTVNANAESEFYTGLWEYTIEVKMQAMPQSELKTVQQCVRELNEVINLFKPDPSCSVSDVQTSASQLGWKLYCKSTQGTNHGDAKLEGNSHALRGRVDLQTVIPGMKNIMRTTYVITGKNKGPCQ